MFMFLHLLLLTSHAQEPSISDDESLPEEESGEIDEKNEESEVKNTNDLSKSIQKSTEEIENHLMDSTVESNLNNQVDESSDSTQTINPVTLDVVTSTSEVPGIEVVKQSAIPVWHYGPDIYLSANLAISYASAASGRERSDFVAISPIELMNLEMTIKGNGSIERCTETNMSSARLKKLTQELDRALAYYDLDLAKEQFIKAEAGLLCLNSILDTDIVSRLYFLQGLLEYNNGEEAASQEAFRNAIRFTANLGWDQMFEPDSKPLFDSAKNELSVATGVPVKIYPERAQDLLWINGIPATDDKELFLHYGDNMLQFEGVDLSNAKIHVESTATEITLIVPAALDKEVIDWVNTTEHQTDLDIITKGIYPSGHELYVLKNGLMYSTTITELPIQWVQNDIPTLIQVFGVNTKSTIGRLLFWTGSSLTTVGGLYSINQASIAMKSAELAGMDGITWEVFNQQSSVYDESFERYQTGVIVTTSAAILTGLGYWMQQ